MGRQGTAWVRARTLGLNQHTDITDLYVIVVHLANVSLPLISQLHDAMNNGWLPSGSLVGTSSYHYATKQLEQPQHGGEEDDKPVPLW